MGFTLDNLSIAHLRGVHPDLVAVVQKCAADIPLPFTFGVSQGLRTAAQQKLYVAQGRSQTMNSRHLDGHAVDLAVLVDGKITWDWPFYYQLAAAMRTAAMDIRIPLIWGGCWDTEMAEFTSDPEHESAQYVIRARGAGKQGFTDGPHYELPRDKYLDGAPTAGIRTA